MEIVQFVADALGDASYLVVSGGDAAVVDPQRDVRPYVAAAERRGVRITHVFETHVHNDYIQLLVETGPLGLLLLGCVVVLSFGKALVAQQRRRDPLARGMAFAAIMGGGALMIHASADFNHQIPANAATFTLLLALAWLANHLGHERRSIRTGNRPEAGSH